MRILVTGATGFVGSALIKHIALQNYTLTAAVRDINNRLPQNITQVVIGDLQTNTDWQVALDNIDVVIHLAARAHIMNDTVDDPLTEFRRINTEATLNLAQQAAKIGIKRFIFLSSIKVNGEETLFGIPFTSKDSCSPNDPYALSKYEAEQGLHKISKQTGLEVIIIRPPLIYGAGVKGNFASMMSWLHRGIPLPLGNINNKRSLVSLENLIDLITLCIRHPAAAHQTFLVSDGKDISTTELLKSVSKSLGKPVCLLPIPQPLLTKILYITGKEHIAKRLCSNLQVDISETNHILGWHPKTTLNETLTETINYYLLSIK